MNVPTTLFETLNFNVPDILIEDIEMNEISELSENLSSRGVTYNIQNTRYLFYQF